MIVQKWHAYLDMPKKDRDWHRQDMADELEEYRTAASLINKWSEASDVVYTYSRGRWSGHDMVFPLGKMPYVLGTVYMYPKYTLRFWFFRKAGKRLGTDEVHEVRNPRKTAKLHHIARKYNLDEVAFQKMCEKQLRHWLLLP